MRVPVGTILLLVLAGVLYAPMMGCFIDAPNSDAFGRGLALAYGAILAGMLWLVLAALLLIAAVKGRMAFWARVGAAVLWPLSCVAVWLAVDAHAAGDPAAIWVPALLPPFITLYALWARFPSLHAVFRADVTSTVLGGAIAFLSLAPLVAATRAALPDPAREVRLAELAKSEEERMAKESQAARDREEAQFASLGPDSPLESYLDYLPNTAYAERALAGIRQAKNRQAGAIVLLQQGRLLDLRQLWQFDVAPSAELCQAYDAALAAAAGNVTTAQSDYLIAATELELQLPNITWLIGNHCDLEQSLGLLESNLRAIADSFRISRFADTVAELRQVK